MMLTNSIPPKAARCQTLSTIKSRQMKPREIFLNACKDIEAKLLPMGYKFIKSEHALIRKTKDFIFEIDFW